MLNDIKKELINHPYKLKEVLEHFSFHNVVIHNKYISFGRALDSSPKSIVVRLENNPYLYVNDYARNISRDIFGYIAEKRKTDFSNILSVVKSVLGISDYYDFFECRGIFGGFYERIRKRGAVKINTYDESVLDAYVPCGNLRFLRDNISLSAQRYFNIRYDVEPQGIVIPIYSQTGGLMGIKIRRNYETSDMKYYCAIPCQCSQTLYGYCHNYRYLAGNTVYVFESEKSVMQCHSYGIRNCAALGSGTISMKQIRMLFELNPQKVIFMHDAGYSMESIMRNISAVQKYSRFSEMETGYWNFFNKGYPDKVSPSDLGKDELKRIMKNEIVIIGGDNKEDEL